MANNPSSRRPQIVVFGGGTGAPVVARSLITAGFTSLHLISASMDSGGKTGIIRSDERDRVIAISDTLRCLLALLPPSTQATPQLDAFIQLISYIDGRNRNLGYSIYYALLEMYSGDFIQVQSHLEKLLSLKFLGTAIPVTLSPTSLCFSTINGNTYRGEDELDRQAMSANLVTRLWLTPAAPATPQAVSAIKSATHIIYSPGSLYGSVLANFLPQGIKSALKQSRAKKILITNLVSTRNENHQFTPVDYINLFKKYTGLAHPIDIIITPSLSQTEFESTYPKEAARYALEHSYFLGWDPSTIAASSHLVNFIRAPLAIITPDLHRIRHDTTQLAQALKTALSK